MGKGHGGKFWLDYFSNFVMRCICKEMARRYFLGVYVLIRKSSLVFQIITRIEVNMDERLFQNNNAYESILHKLGHAHCEEKKQK